MLLFVIQRALHLPREEILGDEEPENGSPAFSDSERPITLPRSWGGWKGEFYSTFFHVSHAFPFLNVEYTFGSRIPRVVSAVTLRP